MSTIDLENISKPAPDAAQPTVRRKAAKKSKAAKKAHQAKKAAGKSKSDGTNKKAQGATSFAPARTAMQLARTSM